LRKRVSSKFSLRTTIPENVFATSDGTMKWGPQLIAICTSFSTHGFMAMKHSFPYDVYRKVSADETLGYNGIYTTVSKRFFLLEYLLADSAITKNRTVITRDAHDSVLLLNVILKRHEPPPAF
jgi:hypothetical protein